MKKSLFTIVICCITISSTAQVNNHKDTNTLDMRTNKFDVELFMKNKINSDEYQYVDNGYDILLIKTPNDYIKIVSKIDENLKTHYLYDKNSLLLTGEQQYFLSIPIGHYVNYTDKGESIKNKELKGSFPFSIIQLIDKMKNDFHLDINKKNKRLTIGIDYNENNSPYYFIRYPIHDGANNSYRFIKIDANSGEFISENVSYDKD
ncbi:hypothetical protein ERX46_17395 [Brumimicrobium glaciale]|uniref:PepSY domain-containing protein n=1 Tax=Brumimicrobium glaciale TaxID=200475 RepID=A0A4Q4KEG7_9FLAO|nr:hypothetical protein [Brumimicrobium glaciale]RYM30857.1 hypothetical protein ERX46_17395 [Brumimicrobium glaciale]